MFGELGGRQAIMGQGLAKIGFLPTSPTLLGQSQIYFPPRMLLKGFQTSVFGGVRTQISTTTSQVALGGFNKQVFLGKNSPVRDPVAKSLQLDIWQILPIDICEWIKLDSLRFQVERFSVIARKEQFYPIRRVLASRI